jgi:hypothetical protein
MGEEIAGATQTALNRVVHRMTARRPPIVCRRVARRVRNLSQLEVFSPASFNPGGSFMM